MAKKLKLKKKFKVILVVLVLLIVGGIYGFNKYSIYKYEQSTEFKLLETGYTKDEISVLEDYFDDKFIESLIGKEKNELVFNLIDTPYYIHSNYELYIAYIEENKNDELEDVVRIINTNLDERFYERLIEADLNKGNLVLVNKYYYLDENYVPDNLVTIGTKYSWGDEGTQKATQETFDAFVNMHTAAYDEVGIYLMISSSYRSYADQASVYETYKLNRGERYADTIAARPGHSEHQTGLALDIFSTASSNRAEFVNSQAFLWLELNAHKYGFILRYAEDEVDTTGYEFESWHYRYVGVDTALKVYDSGLTYDEYYAYYINR